MIFNRIVSYLSGYVEILVRGPQIEKFINLATSSGLFLWDIRRLGQEVIKVKMRAHGFARTREMARKTGCKIKIHHKRGWPFFQRKLIRRKVFIIGFACFILFLCYLSSLVLFIKVEGFKGNEREKLLNSLHRLGIKPGISRGYLLERKRMIEREMMLETPEAVWLGINLRGIVAEVKVIRRKTAPAPSGACDIIASHEGIVTKVAVIRGVPVIKEGDTVARGDLLISGTQWYNDLQSGQVYQEEVNAGGIVEARVWYEIEVLEPKVVWKPVCQNRHYTRFRLKWGNKVYNLMGFGPKPGKLDKLDKLSKLSLLNQLEKNYFWERQRKPLYQGRNPSEVVELIKDTWQEVTWHRVQRPLHELKRVALAEIRRKQKLLMISDKGEENLNWSEEGLFLKLSLTIEKIEDIGLISPR